MNFKIKKYASYSCVKCKLLDKVLKHLGLLDITETFYTDEMLDEKIEALELTSVPTLILYNDDKEVRLVGNILPQDITDAVEQFN